MLNYAAFQVLGDADAISDAARLLFIRLMRDYDLSGYRVIAYRTMRSLYRLTQREVLALVQELTRSGLLELGPQMKMGQAYRIGRPYLLDREDQANWFHSLERRDALRQLAP